MERLQSKAHDQAVDRFKVAQGIISTQPTGLSAKAAPAPAIHVQPFDLGVCVPGSIVEVPLHLIDLNEIGPRQIYQHAEVDKIAETLPKSQDDAAHGYVKDGRVKLIDGGTRYRSAKVSGVASLVVKFEEEPASGIELYLKARRYNDLRSQPTAIDHAISLRKLMDAGHVGSQREIMERIPDLSGRPMSESQVSAYMRIGRMPDRVLVRMSESSHTSGVTILHAVSEIFERRKDPAELAEATELALQVIDDIRSKDLSKQQVIALVKSKLDGVKHRERSSQQSLSVGDYKGVVKIFAKRGQCDLSVKGVPADRLPDLQRALVATIEGFAQAGSGTGQGPDSGAQST
ncbi:ParB/RepB/Spo0J family partition protein [Acidovorax sp.]|uniref:ParB/RepB/Spo0J family partition protein n=1 Tax=Acidovorax sp. TaxID=1872122 RepID=UPI00391F5652